MKQLEEQNSITPEALHENKNLNAEENKGKNVSVQSIS